MPFKKKHTLLSQTKDLLRRLKTDAIRNPPGSLKPEDIPRIDQFEQFLASIPDSSSDDTTSGQLKDALKTAITQIEMHRTEPITVSDEIQQIQEVQRQHKADMDRVLLGQSLLAKARSLRPEKFPKPSPFSPQTLYYDSWRSWVRTYEHRIRDNFDEPAEETKLLLLPFRSPPTFRQVVEAYYHCYG